MHVSDFFSSFSSPWPPSLAPTYLSQAKDTVWGAITTLTGSNFLHNTLASAINPVTKGSTDELDRLRSQLFNPQGEFAAEPVTLRAADGAFIKGAFFPGSSDRAILFALGAYGRYEAVANPEDAAYHFVNFFRTRLGDGMNVLVINTRGIDNDMHSPSIRGCSLDYHAAWSFLESKGLKVLPWGHSLGGRYVVEAAAWKQQEHPTKKICLVSDRSFDDIGNEAKQAFGGGVKGNAVGALMRYSGWSGNVLGSWQRLQGSKLLIVAPEDKTVPYRTASLYKRLRVHLGEETTVVKLRGTDNPHTRIYNNEEERAIKEAVNLLFSEI